MSLLVKTNGTLPALVRDFFDSGNILATPFGFENNMINLNGGAWTVPSANILEHDDSFLIELAAPGLERKDFKVEVDNGILTISSEKEHEKKEKKKNFWRREFSYNSFSRSFTLPENSVTDKIEAKYENGVLRLTLPKKQVTISKPKKEIKIS